MREINFVSKDLENLQKIASLRKTVVAVTTLVLVIYLVISCGVLGWWWYTTSKEKRLETETDEVLKSIISFSPREVAVRRLAGRIEAVNKFVENRGKAASAAGLLLSRQNVEVSSWDYVSGGSVKLELTSTSPQYIRDFVKYLEGFYTRVQLDELVWNSSRGWVGRINLSGFNEGGVANERI